MILTAPFPWPGGKSRVSKRVWTAFGDVPNYVEPFAGSLAVLLQRPGYSPALHTETINELDPYLSNFWRAMVGNPDVVIDNALWPVSEVDLYSRHLWLLSQEGFRARMLSNPRYYDPVIAGWWLWGVCLWIGSDWATERWYRSESGKPYNKKSSPHKKMPHVGGSGRGIHRKFFTGQEYASVKRYLEQIAERMFNVRVLCGDWSRVVTPAITHGMGLTGVFLDPPYGKEAGRFMGMYAKDSGEVAEGVRKWALENGDNPDLRIALCGYTGEHDGTMAFEGWRPHYWKASGGYGNQGKITTTGKENAKREVIWFSPHCHHQLSLFEWAEKETDIPPEWEDGVDIKDPYEPAPWDDDYVAD